jgi:hypothetical protein
MHQSIPQKLKNEQNIVEKFKAAQIFFILRKKILLDALCMIKCQSIHPKALEFNIIAVMGD